MNAPKVDVLGDVEDSIRFECKCYGRNLCQHCHWANDIAAARSAVAELIGAVKEYRLRYGNCGSPIQQKAADKVDAAVARIGGAA
jgi:hypothetical protein